MANALFFIAFFHVMAGSFYNKYRIQQMLQYLSRCRGRELTETEFAVLWQRYTSFRAPARFSPSRAQYQALYNNEEFAAFARQSKYVMVYVYSVFISCFVLIIMLS